MVVNNKENSPLIIDSHAHLNLSNFDQDRGGILEQCKSSGVWVINIGTSFEESRKVVEIAQGFSGGIYATVGVHPEMVKEDIYSQEDMIYLATNNENVVAIGEVGLDYFYSKGNNKKEQKKLLIKQLELAKCLDFPLVLHCRHFSNFDAHKDLLNILREFKIKEANFNFRGVVHCYTGNWLYAKQYLDLGLSLGFTGIITFAQEYDEVVQKTPLERILIETDSPFLSPLSERGKRNSPLNVWSVAEKVSELKRESLDNVLQQTIINTRGLFRI